jgi:hypothetical protein
LPRPYRGDGPIKLIVLGQDPTIKNAAGRANIKTVLNLDKPRSVWLYLQGICRGLGLDLKHNVYATNLYKNFFTEPPTQIKQMDIFSAFLPAWLPILIEELAPFENVPVISLGEPLLKAILGTRGPKRLRDFWGYTANWTAGSLDPLGYVKPEENILARRIFPFPHQPSLRKEFYKVQMDTYISFLRSEAFAT